MEITAIIASLYKGEITMSEQLLRKSRLHYYRKCYEMVGLDKEK